MSFAVVILSKTDANLNRCVDSIRARGETCDVLVVDDGLSGRRGDCAYLAGPQPFIFSRNANLGIEAAGGRDVFLMNDDATLMTALGFTKLAEAVRKSFTGLVSCAIRENVGNHLQLPQAGSSELRILPRGSNIAFVCIFILRSLYDEVGPFDERFIEYGWEDTDYCMRCRHAGYPIMVHDGCHVGHKDGSTFRTQPDIRDRFEAGKRIFEEKWGKTA